jgi:threonine/homoserine/homoserine lactone efflux protein
VTGLLAAMVVVLLPFVLSPGASFSLVLTHTVAGSRTAVGKVIFGTGAGLFVLAALVGLTGFGAALQADPLARRLVTIGGSLVLAVIGGRMISRGLSGRRGNLVGTHEPKHLAAWSFVVLLTNAKALTLYLVVVPTLPSHHLTGAEPYVLFAAVHTALQSLWLATVALLAKRLPSAIRSPRGQAAVLVVTGSAIVSIAALTAMNGLH